MSISVQSLSKIYGKQKAVNNISFEIPKGQIVGFLGPNGAGKSTTMKMITSYLPPSSGTAVVCGFDVQTQSMELRKHVGYLPEQNPLYYDMYVREYLALTAGIHEIPKSKRAERIAEMIKMTGLTKEAHKKIGTLSKGYKQRVGLAQAMIHNPDVLILDEPTSGLDPNQIVDIRDLIIDIGKEKTILLSTHIMQEVEAMCSRVIIINNGTIVADDNIQNLQKAGNNSSLLITLETIVPQALIMKIQGVGKIEDMGNMRWKLFTTKPDELRKAVMQWALNNDINISSLQSETQTMEDVFRNVTQ
ncbi:MAG: gliding motility-associated ABC transporter ATP-binding subunit GldA [Chitinophagaceae bacterium]|nr:gliding motility-associated ABC transporter ATP-binding subunit GldA [Chitinophagaceae bacterium]